MKQLCILMILTVAAASAVADEKADAALVEVLVTFQSHDTFLPWQMKQPGYRRGYGVMVGNSRILTTENLVRNQRLVEVRKARSGEKTTAQVEISDCEVNLALLRIASATKFQDVIPVELAAKVGRMDKLEILQFDETSQIQRDDARVLQIDMSPLPSAPHQSLSYTLLTDLNVNGEGAPVLSEGRLAGLMMTYDHGTRTGDMVPVSLLSRFLKDSAEKTYKGFASAGFRWVPLVDPAKRAFLNVPDQGQGILVLTCMPGSPADKVLRPNDVILEWDGFPIDDLGFYDDPEFGRLDLAYIGKGKHRPGDATRLKLVRDKAVLSLDLTLSSYMDRSALVPENATGEREEYLVAGGFIIRELTGNYLRSHGADWQRYVDPRLVNLYLTRTRAMKTPGEHIVILSGVLPDPINIGYQQFRNAVIESVNGKPVGNMNDVFRVCDEDKNVKRLKLQSIDIDLVLDEATLPTANDRLMNRYRIPSLRYQRQALAPQ